MKIRDIPIGTRSNGLVVEAFAGVSARHAAQWRCKCACGRSVTILACNLKNGQQGCGKCRNKKREVNFSGRRIGKIILTERLDSGKWLIQCDCGNATAVTTARLYVLRFAKIPSCGCENKNGTKIKHGHMTRKQGASPTYRSYASMLSRCSNPRVQSYKDYGGRGIKVCDRWLSFENFLMDMGERPIGTSLDRINNEGNYEPSNCRWATPSQQSNNSRRNVTITYQGKSQTIAQWAKESLVSRRCFARRIRNRGWTMERALSEPSMRNR